MNKRILMMAIIALVAVAAFAQVPANSPAPATTGVKWSYVAAAFVLGIAAAFGALGQGRAMRSMSKEIVGSGSRGRPLAADPLRRACSRLFPNPYHCSPAGVAP